MASCDDDDDFALLNDENHRRILHQPYASHFPPKSTPILPPSQPILSSVTSIAAAAAAVAEAVSDEVDESEEENENDTVSALQTKSEKRRDRDETEINDKSSNVYSHKKARASVNTSGSEFRKDREEWTDSAIACLLDAYLDKFNQLNRGNLRGRDWEEVAAVVSERCEKQSKTVEQCKNKVDNLKKRYKLERHRMSSGGVIASHWPWFKKMEEIVGNSLPSKSVSEEQNDAGSGSSGSAVRQSKRYTTPVASPAAQLSSAKAKPMPNFRWKRVVLKVSGFALAGGGPNNVDPKVMMLVAREVAVACRHGVEIAIVVGGRNFFCGNTWVSTTGSDRRTTYQIGMMASVMNAVLLQSALEKNGIQSRVQTAYPMQEVTEPYNKRRAIRHLEKGRVVIFGGIGAGSGNPLFSTDVAAALQATDLHAEAVLKGTNVDGVYDCHSQDSNATFEHISFRDLISRGAISMDMMALTCCEESGVPVVVFNLLVPGNISKVLCGDQVGTLIDQTGRIS